MTGKLSAHNPPPPEPLTRGLVHIYTGNGKSKTTAALGIVLRALGHGLRAYIVYFMKGDYPYGERYILPQLPNVKFASFGRGKLLSRVGIKPEDREQAKQALAAAREDFHARFELGRVTRAAYERIEHAHGGVLEHTKGVADEKDVLGQLPQKITALLDSIANGAPETAGCTARSLKARAGPVPQLQDNVKLLAFRHDLPAMYS